MGTIGIEWVNKYHGRSSDLKNCDNDARGFYNKLSGTRQFEYSDDLAWDQDFEESGVGSPAAGTDTIYVDNVDIVYFAGHGSSSGPYFGRSDRDDGEGHYSEMRLGNRQSEWLVFSACEVLKRSQRLNWQQVFRGLHGILGFDTVCGDSGDRGEKFARRLNQGETVRCAWIKACEETEGSSTRWASYFAGQSNWDTLNDHWWGKGSVASDPRNPNQFMYCRGPC
jgi:hypothetical protein